jgi:hypothetical protein
LFGDCKGPALNFCEEILTKGTLRGYQSAKTYDVAILVHKCEGRIFLTDRNGFYTDLLATHFLETGGNVLICLIGNSQKTNEDELANSDVTTMATLGDQPTLKLYLK